LVSLSLCESNNIRQLEKSLINKRSSGQHAPHAARGLGSLHSNPGGPFQPLKNLRDRSGKP
jgi:hypothetical protein